ncbi:Leucine-rich repeat [Dillenia turbinata]|uniref:Leucine-rich repeat n=1 Tax=Dillenia turbinata TaxID=194707 RepID=A0AAN8WAG6_9MAGN
MTSNLARRSTLKIWVLEITRNRELGRCQIRRHRSSQMDMQMGSASLASNSLNDLKLGKKIYFEDLGIRDNTKSGIGSLSNPPASVFESRGGGVVQGTQPLRCQVEGCRVGLSDAKAYYSRHKCDLLKDVYLCAVIDRDLARDKLIGDIARLIYWNEVLEYLDISYNQNIGKIPYNIGFLQVATLFLQGNKLTGKIPEVIGMMQALAVLDLNENVLVGPIPSILGNLSYRGKFYLHGIQLIGPIPPEVGNMSKLSYLQLNDNQLVGSIPVEPGKLGQLFELNIANDNLEGPIPPNIS